MYYLSDTEIDKLLKNIVIVIDTAEKENNHIIEWLDKKKHKHIKRKLNFGDYTGYIESNEDTKDVIGNRNIWFNNIIAIERKANLTELANNLKQNTNTGERTRITKEFTKAKVLGCYLTMYVEDPNGIINIFKKQYGKKVNGLFVTNFEPLAFYRSIKSFESDFRYTTGWYSKEMMGHEIYETIRMHIRKYLKEY